MKPLKSIFAGMLLLLACSVQAQVAVNVNIGSPPPWGPAGYSDVRYYYLPDVEAYYDVPSSSFIYYTGGTWVHRKYLPRQYRSYDLYSGYKVVMTDYRGNAPYTYFKEYKIKYAKGYRGQSQHSIGERPSNGKSGASIDSKGSGKSNGKSAAYGNKKNKNNNGRNGSKGGKK